MPPLAQQWHRTFRRPVDGALAADGKVFTSAGSMLYALNPSTGQRVWGPVDTGGTPAGDDDVLTLAYDAGRLFASTLSGQVIAYDASTGRRLWWRGGETVLAGYGALLTSTDDTTTRLDERTGHPIWTFHYRWVARSSLTADEVVLAGYHEYWGLRLSDGALLWHTGGSTEIRQSWIYPPVIFGNRVVADNESTPVPGQGEGQTVMDLTTGAPITTLQGDTAPSIVGDIGVVRRGTSFAGVDLNDGSTVWTFAGDGHMLSSAVAENGDVYLASSAGHLWAVSVADGAVQWSGNIPQGYGNRTGAYGGYAVPMTIGQGLLLVPIDHELVAYRPVFGAQVPSTAALAQPPMRSTTIAERDDANQAADAGHTGRMASVGLRLPLRRAWTRDFSGNVSFALIGSQHVYVVSYKPSNDHSYLHALSRRTGHDV